MEFNPQDQIVLDEEKLKKLQLRIYLLERENYKTKKLKDCLLYTSSCPKMKSIH